MSLGDLRSEEEGEDDLRVGKRVGLGEARLGCSDGTQPEPTGRVRHLHREEQEETVTDPGQIPGTGRRVGFERASGRELGLPNLTNPVMGLFTGRPLAQFPPSGFSLTGCPYMSKLAPRSR